ncbi:hypothetical protein ACO0RG_001382 [Hanseniaspora osmophila]|uniref:54S ribosomal protein MRP49, mitochondrial n=1 Tax=Hanseniaspora osmophila TaxID=56408 RepID=A0A1E5R0G7_9ASCO|nr:54S ribosomal protein MRP49, mitochondrial [Hanseniaspora osmophila]
MSILQRAQKINKISFTTKLTQVKIDHEKVGKIKLVFQRDNMNGHMGARKFWKNYLPTLKFYNIDLPMEVVRIENKDKNKEIPCILEIQDKSLNKEIAKLDMRNLRDTEIAEKLLELLPHVPVPQNEIIEFVPKIMKH